MAVVVKNLYFTHGRVTDKNYTLDGLRMNVPLGSIYGLLGPSGCGKTTLLKCIIGLLKPSYGNVSLFGYRPGDKRSGVPGPGIGYMPQELAIQNDLSIEELLRYFGKLNSMKSEKIICEIDFLVKMLELWDKRRMVGELSGGQKRRVSLAIALLHKPRLLILDEPTVGVDPILTQVIWNLLKTLSSTMNTTVIITTHYIEETKKANWVGFMRKGCILEENNPQKLLEKYEEKYLGDVFLKLCVDQKQHRKLSKIKSNEIKEEIKYPINKNTENVKIPFPSSTSGINKSNNFVYAIIWKFMVETYRNPGALLLLLITTMSIVFSVKLTIGQTPKYVRVGWVVDEPFNSNFHTNFTNFVNEKNFNVKQPNFENNSTAFVTGDNMTESEDEDYKVLYLPDILKRTINSEIIKLIEYSSFENAMQDAKKLNLHGVIHLKSNFSKSYLECDPLFAEFDEYISDETIDTGTIHVHLDFSNLVIGHTIRAFLSSYLKSFRKSIAEHFNMNTELLKSPVVAESINSEDKLPTSIEDVFSVASFITPGIVAFNSFGFCIGMCILSLLVPPECNMFVREYAAGVRTEQKVLGQVTARFIFMCFNAIINLIVMVYVLDVPCRGSIVLIMILMWLQMILGLNIGALMSASMSSSYYSLYTSIAITFIIFSINGVIWTIDAQPYYMKWMTYYTPLYHSINALRAMLFYSNASIQVILPGFAFTILWTILSFIATVCVLKLKN